ncbi:defensin-2-like [Ceratina calcarata]|uniref:Defensin-2-like n=1 Tax=Ceratina calcarata TaxID=156304 RepID=A0AAJ7NCI2_9HYME|nr:defensin-2-like [Ceratina calcarata]
MKFLVLFAIFATVAYVSGASAPQAIYDGPTYEMRQIRDADENEEMGTAIADESTESPLRHRRVTCDVLSWSSKWLSINHSACAVRCLAQRRKGGRCMNGVCVCRK